LLYLPTLKLNENTNSGKHKKHSSGVFVIAVDDTTEDAISVTSDGTAVSGIMFGENVKRGASIRVDQGLDTTEISPSFTIDSDLLETQYIVEMDNRLGKVAAIKGPNARVSFIDDDDIAQYSLTLSTDPVYVQQNDNVSNTDPNEVISGPRGTTLEVAIQASIDLNTSQYLFDLLGSSSTTLFSGHTVKYIDTNIRIQGATTGVQLDVPVRFVKKTA